MDFFNCFMGNLVLGVFKAGSGFRTFLSFKVFCLFDGWLVARL